MSHLPNRLTRENFTMAAVYQQLDIAGVDRSVLEKDKEHWYSNNTITPEKHEEWKKWFVSEARRTFKMTKAHAEKEFAFFDLTYGLRILEKV